MTSNASGKVVVSDVTATELGYLDGVTSAIQTQIDSKQSQIDDKAPSDEPRFTGNVGIGTSSPEAHLELSKSNGTTFFITNPSGYFADQDQSIEFRTSYATTSFIHQKGPNLRIGTMGTSANDGISFYTAGGGGGVSGPTGYTNTDGIPLIDSTYNASIDVPKMKIIANGNVGIGTTNPQYKLQVEGSVSAQKGTNGHTSYFGNMAIGDLGFNNHAGIAFHSISDGNYALLQSIGGQTFLNSSSGQSIEFQENNVTKMAISGGNVGIGTSAPETALDIRSSSGLRLTNTETKVNINDRIGYIDFNNGGYGAAIESCVNVGGSNNNADLRFMTTLDFNNSYVERMRIDRNGNVGIGTNSPKAALHVTDNNGAIISSSETTGNRTAILRLGSPYQTNHDAYCSKITSTNNQSNNYNSDLRFYTSVGNNADATERMTILSGGNIGIGTTNPTEKLHVHDGGFSVTGYYSNDINSTITPGVHIGTYGNSSTPYGLIQLVAGAEEGSWIDFKDTTSNNTNTDYEGRIRYSSGGSLAGMSFYTNHDERIRISLNGAVGIGTTSSSEKLVVNGNIKAMSYIATSDARHKENICDLENSLEKICSIRGVNFNFKDDENQKHAGILAQEVDSIIPEAINKKDDEKWSANYNTFVGYLIESVKTLKKENDDQNVKIENLESKLETQGQLIQKLMEKINIT